MKENRAISFLIMTLVYAVTVVLAIFLYRRLSWDFWRSLLFTDIAATVFVFIFSLLLKNASVYDPYWSVQPIVIVLAFGAVDGLNLLGWLLVTATCVWGTRLTANWAYTFPNLNGQDWRYTMLHEKTGHWYPVINFVGIHLVPTLVVYLCILPAVVAIKESLEFKPYCLIFLLLALTAVIIQGTADYQMHRFRKDRTGSFIRVGLWKHGRHPNYFGEILMWWSIGLTVVCAAPHKWYLLAGAVANTLLFFFVSIPLAEGRQGKKPGFAEYKKETRVLI